MSPEYNQSFPWYSHTAAYERAREEHDVFLLENTTYDDVTRGSFHIPEAWPDQAHYEAYLRLFKAMDAALYDAMYSLRDKRPPCIDVFTDD